MNTTPTVAQPAVALADAPSRVPLTVARWLAYAEGMISLFGACMMVSSGAASHLPKVAAIAAALGIVSLALGWKVGGGSSRAAIILLVLSISRGVATALPGSPEWWTTLPQLTLLELIVFGLGVRAALALEKHEAPRLSVSGTIRRPVSTQVASPVARQTARTGPPQAPAVTPATPRVVRRPVTAVPREYLTASAEIADDPNSRSRRLDLIVGGTTAALSVMMMMVPVPTHAEGLQGIGEAFTVGLGILDFALAIILLASGHFARQGGRWGERVRRVAYFLIGSQALFGVRILFSVATASIRH
ncbi:MAG: hypothetical protein ACJ79X_06055 [Gemmatimonadaceae bacterium]